MTESVSIGRRGVSSVSADFSGILDESTARLLRSWAATLIPGDEHWPRGDDADVVGHVASTVVESPEQRDDVIHVLESAHFQDDDFNQLGEAGRVHRLRQVELDDPQGFRLIRDLVYEAYYTNAEVRVVLESRTGYDPRAAVDGVSRATFEDVIFLMAAVAERPRRVREVPQ